jgi:hypothetical protein
MTTPTTNMEYKVVRLDSDSTTDELSKALSDTGRDGWKLASTYHLHHLNSIDFVFCREIGSTTK